MYGQNSDKYSGGFMGRANRPIRVVSENRSAFVYSLLMREVGKWIEEAKERGLEKITGFKTGVIQLVIWKNGNSSEFTRIGELCVTENGSGFKAVFTPT